MKKQQALTSTHIQVKSAAVAAPDAKQRGEEEETPKKLVDLNFKVDAAYRRKIKILAAEHNLKQNELFKQAIEAWEEKHGIKSK